VHETTELECYRAVAAESQKWEAWEERMIWQLQRLEAAELLRAQVTPGEDSGAVTSLNEECGSHYENRQRSTETSRRVTIQSPTSRDCTAESPGSPTTPSSSGSGSPEPTGQVSKQSPSVDTVEQVNEVRSFPLEASTRVFAGESTEADTGVGRGVSRGSGVTGRLSTETSTVVSTPPGVPTEPVTGVSLTSAALLAQQLPPLPKFTGESHGEDGETFQDWKVQFEMVASICKWDPQMKLANLVTRLQGQAFAFYKSCTHVQCSNYDAMMEELTK